MTQNPYADTGVNQGFEPDVPARTSIMAIVSLIFSLTCVLGPLGLLFGGLSLIFIGTGKGRLKGTGIAIAGVVIGLITTVLLGAAIAGMVQANQAFAGAFVGPSKQLVEAVEARDYVQVRSQFDASVSASVTDEAVDAFAEAVSAQHGALVSTPDSFLNAIGLYAKLEPAIKQVQGSNNKVPLPAEFANGAALMVPQISQTSAPQTGRLLPPLMDFGVIGQDGTAIWLIKDAPSPSP